MFNKFIGSFKKKRSDSNADQTPTSKQENCDELGLNGASMKKKDQPERNAYMRPQFLRLSEEEEEQSRNFEHRPIISPKDSNSPLPLGAGYAECINGGKSSRNEDQAAVGSFFLPNQPNGYVDQTRKMDVIDVQYFGIFDGHAGTGAALMAADQLINHLQERLVDIQEDLFSLRTRESHSSSRDRAENQTITIDSLVIGALEGAFLAFDEHIAQERQSFHISGGCAVLVAIAMLDRLYLAHAGDCRAVASIGNETKLLATEFTPETDAPRIQKLAHLRPELTHGVFSENLYLRALSKKDIGNRVLCRGPQRTGWHYTEITEADMMKPPLVSGRGKWARLMGVIGVTRGFGDHDLVIPGTTIGVKPFMTALPEVRVLNLQGYNLQEEDFLVMGCDGLWDLVRTEQIVAAVKASFAKSKEEKNPDKFGQAAKDVVHLARGDNTGKGWKMKDGSDASFDDITAFVIPLQNCLSGCVSR